MGISTPVMRFRFRRRRLRVSIVRCDLLVAVRLSRSEVPWFASTNTQNYYQGLRFFGNSASQSRQNALTPTSLYSESLHS